MKMEMCLIQGTTNKIGYINTSKYIGNINSYPVIDKYYWTIEMTDIRLNNVTLGRYMF